MSESPNDRLHPELEQIVHQTIYSIDNGEPYYSAETNWRGELFRQTHYRPRIMCCVRVGMLSDRQEQAIQTFEHWLRSGRKFDTSRFKGLLPVRYDFVYSPSTFERELRAEFTCDSFEAPNGVDELIAWEMEQLESPAHVRMPESARVPAHMRESAPAKPKKEDHFDEELFDL